MTAPPTPTQPTTYPATMAGVTSALKALGTTPRRVADRLHAGRHLGEPGEASDCPVARYLSAVLDRHVTVTVGIEDVYIQPAGPATAGQFRVSLPRPVRRFISRFDNGEFRHLLPDHTDPDDPDDTTRKEV
jgi:hypothetical protein